MFSETSESQKSSLEFGAFDEKQSSTETSEESVARVVSLETNSETSECKNSNLESNALAEKPRPNETAEESINRIASAETMSSSAPPAQKKKNCALEVEPLSDMISQLVSIIVLITINILLHILKYFFVLNKMNISYNLFFLSDLHLPARN